MAADGDFDWRPHGESWWRETATAARINATEQQLRFACARQRGATQADAARLAGYARRLKPADDDPGGFRATGSSVDGGKKVQRLLKAAAQRLGMQTEESGGVLDDQEIEKLLSQKARAGDLQALKELRQRRAQAPGEAPRDPVVLIRAIAVEDPLVAHLLSCRYGLPNPVAADKAVQRLVAALCGMLSPAAEEAVRAAVASEMAA